MGPARLAWENSGRCVLCCDQLQDIELLQEDKPSRPKFPQPGLAFPGPLSSRSRVTVHTARAGTRHRENQQTLTRTERRESGGMNGAGEAGRCRPGVFSSFRRVPLHQHHVIGPSCSHSHLSADLPWKAIASQQPGEAKQLQTCGACKIFNQVQFVIHSDPDVPDNSCWPRTCADRPEAWGQPSSTLLGCTRTAIPFWLN